MKRPKVQTVVPDLLDTLARIETEARKTCQNIAAGHTPKGSAALVRIAAEAKDARERARERA